jgi:hypothetical protein
MQRNALLIAGVAGLVVVATLGAVALGANGAPSTEAQSPDRHISVSGTGTVQAAPDQALVRVTVTADGNDSESVRSTLASDAADLRSALDELGVEYETARYEIEQLHPRERERRGEDAPEYSGVHAFEVTVENTDDVGAVIEAATGAGAEVDAVRLTLSDERRSELRDQAIESAMNDARSQASTIASAGNLTVTGVATVDAARSRYEPVAYETAAEGGDGGGDGPPTVVDAGEVTVTYRVQVTYNASA